MVEELLRALSSGGVLAGILVVSFAGMMEYLFPPFPGDTLMLFGFFLAGHGDLPFAGVLVAALVGSLAGAEAAYQIGGRMGRSYFFLQRSRFAATTLPTLERAFARFGARMILLNRFLPVLRGFFLYAAGMAKMPRKVTFLYANLSNLAWILLIAWVGHRFGSTWENLKDVFKAYTAFVGVVLLAYLGYTLVRYRGRRRVETSR